MAKARLAQRQVARAVRADTLLSTVQSTQCSHFPTRRPAAARAAPSTPRLMSAARVGPVIYGLLLTFRGLGRLRLMPRGVARESSGPARLHVIL